MTIFDNLSENIDDLKESVNEMAKKIQVSSKELKEQTLIRLEISKEEKNLSELYRSIGEEFYREHNKLSNFSDNFIENKIEEIDIVIAKIESLKIKLSKNTSTYSNSEGSGDGFKKKNPDSIVYIDEEDLKK